MSVDVFQEKIRRMKNPSVLLLEAFSEWVPLSVLDAAETKAGAFEMYYMGLLDTLKSVIPAVRFGFGSFAVLGDQGLAVLSKLMYTAKGLGYYVLLDAPQMLSPMAAKTVAQALLEQDSRYICDGIIFSAWLGSDILKEFLPLVPKGKSLFSLVRTANKSASEIQDLLTGARLVHTAAADIVSRRGETVVAKCGYSQIGAVAAASSADSLRSLRSKYSKLFLLLDGYDYPNANAKNCSYAFDRLGHGAAACGGSCIVAAWQEDIQEEADYLQLALLAAERMKKNLTRYITVL